MALNCHLHSVYSRASASSLLAAQSINEGLPTLNGGPFDSRASEALLCSGKHIVQLRDIPPKSRKYDIKPFWFLLCQHLVDRLPTHCYFNITKLEESTRHGA